MEILQLFGSHIYNALQEQCFITGIYSWLFSDKYLRLLPRGNEENYYTILITSESP